MPTTQETSAPQVIAEPAQQVELNMPRTTQHINLVGPELEGGWDESCPESYGKPECGVGCIEHSDGSVEHVDGDYVGELVPEKPLTLRQVAGWLGHYWPTSVSNRCGFHVHFSFKTMLPYSILMDYGFYKDVFIPAAYSFCDRLALASDRSNMRARLDGGNSYCYVLQHNDVVRQAECTSKPEIRYRHLNYCFNLSTSSRTRMQTLEVRLAPMFKRYTTGIDWVEMLDDLFNNYINSKLPVEPSGLAETMVVPVPAINEGEEIVYTTDWAGELIELKRATVQTI